MNIQPLHTYFEKHNFSPAYLTSSRDFELLYSISTVSVLYLFPFDPFFGPFNSGFRGLKSNCSSLQVCGVILRCLSFIVLFVFHLLIFLTCSLRSDSQSEHTEKLSSPLPWSFSSSSSVTSGKFTRAQSS